eukprot:TRINITY_DN43838_c0_g1_i1.p1 TRINITY_DN43838_c0_g1~~TRINITY_DN43838_c0_g1_i1.p1  ORF type:complete len:448 (+),score=94.84 TRINITY_DN43838_c0_g1_i1:211-1554(+)
MVAPSKLDEVPSTLTLSDCFLRRESSLEKLGLLNRETMDKVYGVHASEAEPLETVEKLDRGSWFKGDSAPARRATVVPSMPRHPADPCNKNTIFQEVNDKLHALGKIPSASSPDIEFIFQEYVVPPGCRGCPRHLGRFGHAAIKYTLPDRENPDEAEGPQVVVDVCRPTDEYELIEFYERAEDYVIGNDGQRGLVSRNIVGVRIERVDHHLVLSMHDHFQSVINAFRSDYFNKPEFLITGGRCSSIMDECFWWLVNLVSCGEHVLRRRQPGNCAVWITGGMVVAGLLPQAKLFPKDVVATLLEERTAVCGSMDTCVARGSNVNVVYYKQLGWSARERSARQRPVQSLVHVMKPSSNIAYWDLLPFADVVVENEPCGEKDVHECRLVVVEGRGKRMNGCLWRNHGILVKYLLIASLIWLPFWVRFIRDASGSEAVSYTHLTLPTKRIV